MTNVVLPLLGAKNLLGLLYLKYQTSHITQRCSAEFRWSVVTFPTSNAPPNTNNWTVFKVGAMHFKPNPQYNTGRAEQWGQFPQIGVLARLLGTQKALALQLSKASSKHIYL